MDSNIADLVRQAQLGRKDAFGALIDKYRDTIFAVCFSRCGNSADAQDLTQEVFVRAYKSLHKLQQPEKFLPWLYAIAAAASADWFRHRKREYSGYDDDILQAGNDQSVEEHFRRRETHRLVELAMEQLPEPQRLVASLHYLSGCTCAEISAMTGIGLSAVKMRLQRGRERLRASLSDGVESLTADVRAQHPAGSFTRRVLAGLSSFEKEEIFSHLRALRSMLEYLGVRVDWDYLMGASGEAFSIYFSPGWSYLASFVHSWDVMSAGCAAYGRRSQWHLDIDFPSAIDIISGNVSDGVPVAAPGIMPSASEKGGSETHFWFVISEIDPDNERITLSGVGEQEGLISYPWYERNGDRVHGWHGMVRCLDVYPGMLARNPLFVAGSPRKRPTREHMLRDSLSRAVHLAGEGLLDAPGLDFAIHGGVSGLEEWARALRASTDEDISAHRTPVGNQYHYGSVIFGTSRRIEGARRAAAAYLHRLVETRPGLPAQDLIQAAGHYERMAGLAREVFELFFDPRESVAALEAVSRYPKPIYFEKDEVRAFWNTFYRRFFDDTEARMRGAELVQEIASHERAASEYIRKALHDIESSPG